MTLHLKLSILYRLTMTAQ